MKNMRHHMRHAAPAPPPAFAVRVPRASAPSFMHHGRTTGAEDMAEDRFALEKRFLRSRETCSSSSLLTYRAARVQLYGAQLQIITPKAK